MKKIIFCIAFLCALSFASGNDELFVGKCVTDIPNGGSRNAEYSILYNDSLGQLIFYYNDGYYSIMFELDSAVAASIRENIQKFHKWDKAARKEKVDVSNRALPNHEVEVYYMANTIVQESGTAKIRMSFSSTDGAGVFIMVFAGENFKKFFLFDSRMAKSFNSNITQENVRKAIEKNRKKKKKLDEIFK